MELWGERKSTTEVAESITGIQKKKMKLVFNKKSLKKQVNLTLEKRLKEKQEDIGKQNIWWWSQENKGEMGSDPTWAFVCPVIIRNKGDPSIFWQCISAIFYFVGMHPKTVVTFFLTNFN